MRKQLFYTFVISLVCSSSFAQSPFPTIDSVNINNINAAVLVHGDMWWNPATQLPLCNFPNGSVKNIGFTSAIWMSGYDGSGQLHVAAQTYRQNGNDYWPGPLNGSDTLTYDTSAKWAKIWKVNRSDIQYFQSLSTHDSANTPQSILTWPGYGNTYATGNGGASITMYAGNTYAPFADLNGNGIYEPLLGEYPDVPGDQALWWIYSDNGPTHTESLSLPLGVEVQAMAYAYNRGTLIDNVVYYKYKIINRSANTYTNFRLGQYADMDLGYYLDDFIGFDSSHRMGIVYNGNNNDGLAGGSPANSYGNEIPIAGVTMISLPGDSNPSFVPAGSFDYYNNDGSNIGNPANGVQYNYYMRSEIRTGAHFTDDFISAGTPAVGTGAGPNTNYVYPGDPSDSTQWSECVAGNTPGDRRFVITSNDFTLTPGAVQTIVMALVTTNPDSLNGCPSQGFAGIKAVADTAWNNYYNPPLPPPAAVANVYTNTTISIYPNPAHDQLYIANTDSRNGDVSIKIYNTLGQLMDVAINYNTTSTVDISHLIPGAYYVTYRKNNVLQNATFIRN